MLPRISSFGGVFHSADQITEGAILYYLLVFIAAAKMRGLNVGEVPSPSVAVATQLGYAAGILGVICVVLAFYALGTINANWAGLAFVLVALGLFVLDGAYYSAPACVTSFTLDSELRTYDAAGRVTDRGLGNGLAQKFVYYPWDTQGGRLRVIAAGSPEAATWLMRWK